MQQRGFNDLPNELIHEVFEYVDVARPKYPPKNRAEDVFYILARLSRRMKPIALNFARRHRYFKNIDEFEDFQQEIDAWSSRNYVEEVEECENFKVTMTICIGRVPYLYGLYTFDRYYDKFFFSWDWFQWPNLVSFECVDAVTTPGYNFEALSASSSGLRNLVLLWRCNLLFPEIGPFPKLKTLRLFMVDVDRNGTLRPSPPIGTYGSLRTLAIHELYSFDAIERCCRGLSFPNLRVLKLTYVEGQPSIIYDFVQRHSTLLEVNICFSNTWDEASPLRLEALLKLIDGTGTWVRPSEGSGLPVDQPSLKDVDAQSPTRPPSWKESYGVFYEFAFSRRPLSPEASRWRSSTGSPHARFKCTAFAVNWIWPGANEAAHAQPRTEHVLTDPVEFVCNPPHFQDHFWSDVQQLRLASELMRNREIDYHGIMRLIAESLSLKWPRLRCLAVYWPKDECLWHLPHSDEPEDSTACRKNATLFLEKVFPPAFEFLGTRPIYPREEDPRLEDAVKEVLQLPKDADLDKGDPDLLLSAWKARNYVVASEGIRLLASAHKLLEEVEWYAAQDLESRGVLRWVWKILRHPDGSVKDVVDDLSWTGCKKGSPPPLLVLVGQELEFAYRDAEGSRNDTNFSDSDHESDEDDMYAEHDSGSDASR